MRWGEGYVLFGGVSKRVARGPWQQVATSLGAVVGNVRCLVTGVDSRKKVPVRMMFAV